MDKRKLAKLSMVPHTYNKAGWWQVQNHPELQEILSQNNSGQRQLVKRVSASFHMLNVASQLRFTEKS